MSLAPRKKSCKHCGKRMTFAQLMKHYKKVKAAQPNPDKVIAQTLDINEKLDAALAVKVQAPAGVRIVTVNSSHIAFTVDGREFIIYIGGV